MIRFIIIFLLTIVFTNCLFAQPAQELYENARQHAHSQEYDEAAQLLNTILLSNANHYDAKLLLAQVHAWNNQYVLSARLLTELITGFPPSPDAYDILAKVELWQEAYLRCITVCEKGLQLYPENISLQLTKARALGNTGDIDNAVSILEGILSQNQDKEYPEAAQLLKHLKYKEPSNAIIIDYAHAYFSNTFTPWHTASLAYRRKTSWGSFTGRVNSTYRFDQQGVLYEIDAYPKIGKRSYAYLNAGISKSSIFPQYRFGAEYFRLLPNKLEISAGIRGLSFDEIYINVLTLQLGHYFSHYWLSARGFMATIDNKHTLTGTVTLRRYLSNSDQYFTLYTGSGATPLSVVSISEIRRLKTHNVALDYQHPFQNRKLLAGAKIGYHQEIYPEIRSTSRYTLLFSLAKRF